MASESVGIRIRNLRELNHYTREDLAEMADISSKFLYEIETAQKGFSVDTLLKICTVLDVSCDYILTGVKGNNCNEELINIVEMFDATQVSYAKKCCLFY